MSKLLTRKLADEQAFIHPESAAAKLLARKPLAEPANEDAPEAEQPFEQPFDQTFELPTGLFIASLACFTGFLAILAIGFGNPGLIIPMAIFGIFFAGFYGVPALFVRQAPEGANKSMGWAQFKREGIATATGRLPANEAAIQMLILPVLILVWGFVCVTIAALV